MYCIHCGKEIADNSTFCQHCGQPVAPVSSKPINSQSQGAAPFGLTSKPNPQQGISHNTNQFGNNNNSLPPVAQTPVKVQKKKKNGFVTFIICLVVVIVLFGLIRAVTDKLIEKRNSASSSSTTSESSMVKENSSETTSSTQNNNTQNNTNQENSKTNNSTSNSTATQEKMAYEITDTIFEISDSYFGNGKECRVIIEVTNTGNVPIYLDDCVLDFEDDDGHLLETYDFLSSVPDIVQPGEKGYFYTNGNHSFNEDVSFENGCNLVPKLSIEKTKGELKSHEVVDVSLYNSDYGTVGCRGRIVNETDKEISLIYVTTVYYDSEGKVLGISGTNVMDITAKDQTSFDDSGMLMPDFDVEDVADYKIYADEMYLQF